METGDEVTTTLGGRLVRGTVLYVRDGSVRIDVPGRKPITRPIARVKLVRVKALPAGARCSVEGCGEMRGYYLNECYEHAGPDPYADDEPGGGLAAVHSGLLADSAMHQGALQDRISALAPTVVELANKAVAAGHMNADEHIEAVSTRTLPVELPWDRILRPVPKPPKPWRSEAYRAFVRDWSECTCCGMSGGYGDAAMEAHHHGPHAMGEKAGDEKCIPLRLRCHRYFHDHGTFKGADREETDRIARAAQVECMRAWFAYLKLDADAVIVDALIAHIRGAA